MTNDGYFGPEVAAFVARHAATTRPEVVLLQDPTGALWAYDFALDCWCHGAQRFPAEDRALMETVLGQLVEIAV